MHKSDTVVDESLEQFYDRRFEQGYMDDWPAARKNRVAETVGSSGVPASGRALDFGCGQGVFTEIIRQTLQSWDVVGSDLSSVAVKVARERFPACRFVEGGQAAAEGPFDLIFTHHVLEHVDDLAATCEMLGRMLAPGGRMIHILPCGNAGSLEHRICRLRRDGIDPNNGRYFHDEEGHLRRLSSAQLAAHLRPSGLEPSRQSFANQFWGALDWMSGLEIDELRRLLDPDAASDRRAARELRRWRRRLVALRLIKRPPAILFRRRVKAILGRYDWSTGDRLWLLLANPLFGVAFGVRAWLRARSGREWRTRRHDPAGSEMYLVFQHDPTRPHVGQ